MRAKHSDRQPTRFGSGSIAASVLTLALVLAGCSSSTPDLESIGLSIETDIQAGQSFEVAFPVQTETTLTVVSAPTGVNASIAVGPELDTNLLRVEVDGDTPRGTYNLGIGILRDGEETVLGWPFEVVD